MPSRPFVVGVVILLAGCAYPTAPTQSTPPAVQPTVASLMLTAAGPIGYTSDWELVASVHAADGTPVPGAVVTFTASSGAPDLAAPVTLADGLAQTRLRNVTAFPATVHAATAGATADVAIAAPPVSTPLPTPAPVPLPTPPVPPPVPPSLSFIVWPTVARVADAVTFMAKMDGDWPNVIGFEWDRNGDGIYEQTSGSPIISIPAQTYAAGTYTPSVRVTTYDGRVFTATGNVLTIW